MDFSAYQLALIDEMDSSGLSEIIGGSQHTIDSCKEQFDTVQWLVGTHRNIQILEFGSGCGRLAVSLTEYLSKEGKYVGVDIIPALVNFCHSRIASRFENFSFFLTPDTNKLYKKYYEREAPNCPTMDSLLNLGNARFDVIVSFSVFTHLTVKEAGAYLRLFRTLMKPSGKLIISCFLFNPSSKNYLRQGKSSIDFKRNLLRVKGVSMIKKMGGLHAVGYDEENFQNLALENGFDTIATTYGHWCGRPKRNSFQDVTLLSPTPIIPDGFNAESYLKLNPDVSSANHENLEEVARSHYLKHGIIEGRKW